MFGFFRETKKSFQDWVEPILFPNEVARVRANEESIKRYKESTKKHEANTKKLEEETAKINAETEREEEERVTRKRSW